MYKVERKEGALLEGGRVNLSEANKLTVCSVLIEDTEHVGYENNTEESVCLNESYRTTRFGLTDNIIVPPGYFIVQLYWGNAECLSSYRVFKKSNLNQGD